jgi:hypothetical protein
MYVDNGIQYPLNGFVPPKFEYQRALEIAKKGNTKHAYEAEQVARWLHDPSVYNQVTPETGDEKKCRISHEELQQLVRGGLYEPYAAEAKGHLAVWSVSEPWKRRRRLINETTSTNRCTRATAAIPDIKDVLVLMSDVEYCRTFDFSSWYHQFTVAASVAGFFVFRCSDGNYALRRMPMGQRQSCTVGQNFSVVLAEIAFSRYRSRHGHEAACASVVFIDNILFGGHDRAVVDEIAEEFTTLCHELSATIGETQAGTSVTFLGLDFDLAQKTFRLGSKSVGKHNAVKERCYSATQLTARQIMALCGTLVYEQYVSGSAFKLAPAFMLWLAHEHVAQEAERDPKSLDDLLQLSPDVSAAIRSAFDAVDTDRVFQLRQPVFDTHLVIDASSTGWGAAILSDGVIEVFHNTFDDSLRQSQCSEAAAFTHLVKDQRAAFLLRSSRHLRIFTDHSGLLKGLRWGIHITPTTTGLFERCSWSATGSPQSTLQGSRTPLTA